MMTRPAIGVPIPAKRYMIVVRRPERKGDLSKEHRISLLSSG